MEPDHPDFRATVLRDGTVRLVGWGPWLATGGPLASLLVARGRAGVAITDLTVVRDDQDTAVELIASFLCGDAPERRRTLCDWAAHVGYRRIWFDGELVELDPAPGGTAETRCSGCRARLVDFEASFWEYVRTSGAFPFSCVLCGSDLPQWTPARQTSSPARDQHVMEPSRQRECENVRR